MSSGYQLFTCRPISTTLVNGWTNVGGAASFEAAASDNLDTTYLQSPASTGEAAELLFKLTNLSLGSTSIVKWIQPRIRVRSAAGLNPCALVEIGNSVSGDERNEGSFGAPAAGVITTIVGPKWSVKTEDVTGPYKYFDMANLDIGIIPKANSDLRVYEVYLDVAYNDPPTIAVTAPSGVVTATATPTVTWTYFDFEGDSQERYWIKVFDSVTYGGGSFNPETSKASWDSGQVYNSDARSKVIGTGLANLTNYRVYMKGSDAGSNGRWSPWVYQSFNTNFAPAPIPTAASATADAANARYNITYTPGASPATDWFDIERSDDAGTTWHGIRGGYNLTNIGTATIRDYEYIPLVTPQYRVRAVRLVSGAPMPSAWVVLIPPSALISKTWWLKDPLDPTKNCPIEVIPPFTFQRREPQALYDALGRSDSIFTTDGFKGTQGSVKIRTRTLALYNQLWSVVGQACALYLEDWSMGRSWYVKMGETGDYSTVMSAPDIGSVNPVRHLHEATYAIRQVGQPDLSLVSH